jgi:hypothetical protein
MAKKTRKQRNRPRRRVPYKTGRAVVSQDSSAQSGTILDDRSRRVGQFALSDGVFDLDTALQSAQELASTAQQQQWEIRAIFALRRQDSPVRGAIIKPIRQVGLFLFKPRGLTIDVAEDVIHRLGFEEADMRLREARDDAGRVVKDKSVIFVVEDPAGTTGVSTINRNTLVRHLLSMWRKPPVNTNGIIQLWYDRINIRLSRADLMKTSARDTLFGHLQHVLELMKQGFRYDPWAGDQPKEGQLRRVNEQGFGPWVKDRQ